MISDEVFRTAMDKALKSQGLLKSERNARIAMALTMHVDGRDMLLDIEQQQARLVQKKESIPSEYAEQCSFVLWFRSTYPDVKIHAIPNGADVTPGQRIRLVAEGLLKGVADLKVEAWNLHIEMKISKGGVQSPEQKDWEQYVRSIGHIYLLCNGAEHAKTQVSAFADIFNR